MNPPILLFIVFVFANEVFVGNEIIFFPFNNTIFKSFDVLVKLYSGNGNILYNVFIEGPLESIGSFKLQLSPL